MMLKFRASINVLQYCPKDGEEVFGPSIFLDNHNHVDEPELGDSTSKNVKFRSI